MRFEASGCVTGGVIMLIERLQVRGLLSFGPKGIDLPLGTAERHHRPERKRQVKPAASAGVAADGGNRKR